MRTSAVGLVMLALFFVCAPPGRAQEPQHYSLPATPENVQWGWYDPTEKPKLVINSGDTVSIETLSHSLGQVKPGLAMDGIVKLRKENGGGGPHSITGPIYVTGAEPGDTTSWIWPKCRPSSNRGSSSI
jgi:acetamidase/formamidase